MRANTQSSGTDELSIQFAILELTKDQRIWTNADLKFRLRKSFDWSDEDLKVGSRTSEYKWENRINNALSPSRKSSLYGKGFVENCGHGEHKITPDGIKFINDDFELGDLLNAL